MSSASQFFGGDPIGTIKMGIGLPADKWIPCDGRSVSRAAWPALSALFPIGALTGTVRTQIASNNKQVAASPTYFVASTGASVQSMQYSTDGATWATTSLVTINDTVSRVIWAGSRFVAMMTGQQPVVTTGDNPNSTWTNTINGPGAATATTCGLAYSPTLGLTVSHSAANVYTLADGSTTWVSRGAVAPTGANGVVWTGTRFIIPGNGTGSSRVSTDGITWANESIPSMNFTPGVQNVLASNGSGVVVLSQVNAAPKVSTDHGATWRDTVIPGWRISNASVNYSGDRFFLSSLGGLAMSLDGVTFAVETIALSLGAPCGCAKKGAVIVQVIDATTAYSLTESGTNFNTPNLPIYTNGLSANSYFAQAPYYIKGA